MNTRVIIIVGFSYLYGLFEAFMNFRQRRNGKVKSSGDKGSLWLLYILIAVGFTLSFSIGSTRTGRIYDWDTFFAIGVVLTVIGLIIRIVSILTLKEHFTYSVAIIENHKLIETGLYKSIRHPGYLGQLVNFHWDCDFIVELAINCANDNSDCHRIHSPNWNRRKIYD